MPIIYQALAGLTEQAGSDAPRSAAPYQFVRWRAFGEANEQAERHFGRIAADWPSFYRRVEKLRVGVRPDCVQR